MSKTLTDLKMLDFQGINILGSVRVMKHFQIKAFRGYTQNL